MPLDCRLYKVSGCQQSKKVPIYPLFPTFLENFIRCSSHQMLTWRKKTLKHADPQKVEISASHFCSPFVRKIQLLDMANLLFGHLQSFHRYLTNEFEPLVFEAFS